MDRFGQVRTGPRLDESLRCRMGSDVHRVVGDDGRVVELGFCVGVRLAVADGQCKRPSSRHSVEGNRVQRRVGAGARADLHAAGTGDRRAGDGNRGSGAMNDDLAGDARDLADRETGDLIQKFEQVVQCLVGVSAQVVGQVRVYGVGGDRNVAAPDLRIGDRDRG